MNWIKLTDLKQLDQINEESKKDLVLLFKHSTRCNISAATLNRLERNWKEGEIKTTKLYLLDLISYRQISDAVAETYSVDHQSPQVLIIQNEKSVYDRSHFDISYEGIKSKLQEAQAKVTN